MNIILRKYKMKIKATTASKETTIDNFKKSVFHVQ